MGFIFKAWPHALTKSSGGARNRCLIKVRHFCSTQKKGLNNAVVVVVVRQLQHTHLPNLAMGLVGAIFSLKFINTKLHTAIITIFFSLLINFIKTIVVFNYWHGFKTTQTNIHVVVVVVVVIVFVFFWFWQRNNFTSNKTGMIKDMG